MLHDSAVATLDQTVDHRSTRSSKDRRNSSNEIRWASFSQVTKKTVVRPNQRYQNIKEIVENRRFNEDKYLKEIGMTVDDKEMVIVEGRLIAPPEVKYISGRDGQSEVVERINIGKYVRAS